MIGPPGPGASRVCLAKKEASVSRPTSAPDSLLNLKGSAGAKVVPFMTGATCIPWGLPGTGPGTRSSPHLPFAVVVLARGAAGAASCPCRCGEEVAGLPLCPMMLPPARSPGPSGLERALQVQGPRVMTAVGAARPLLLPVPLTAYLSLCVCVCVCVPAPQRPRPRCVPSTAWAPRWGRARSRSRRASAPRSCSTWGRPRAPTATAPSLASRVTAQPEVGAAGQLAGGVLVRRYSQFSPPASGPRGPAPLLPGAQAGPRYWPQVLPKA